MTSVFIKSIILPLTLRWVKRLQTQRSSISIAEKLLRSVLALPAIALLVAALRVRLAFIGPLEVEARTLHGQTFRCMLPDLIQMYLALFGVWEPDVVSFARSRVRDGDVVLDVGANIGAFALPLAQQVGPGGRIVALEPLPQIHQELQRNVERNQFAGRITIIAAAASDSPKEMQIHAGPAWNIGKASARAGRELGAPSSVPAAPLANLVDPTDLARARLIKIDVEGAEDAVLRGLAPSIARLHPACEVLIELSPAWWSDRSADADLLLKPFREAGFHIYRIANNYWPWRYLWPRCVSRPQRLRNPLAAGVKRVDLVLSRTDAEAL